MTKNLERAGSNDATTLQSLYELTRWSLSVSDGERIVLGKTGAGGAPEWTEDLFTGASLDDLRSRFSGGERLAIRANLVVHRKHAAPVDSHFDVFLQTDDSIRSAEEHYVRQGITITGIRKLRDRPVRGLVVAENEAIATLLGDSENPAHTDWQERANRVRTRYERGGTSVRFVKNSLRKLVDILGRTAEGRDEDLLSEIFFLEMPAEEEASKKAGRKKGRRAGRPPVPPLPGRQRSYSLERISGGFRLRGDPKGPGPPDRIVIRVAYETRRGNPFKAYDPLDFELHREPITVEATGLQIASVARNRIEAHVQEPAFSLSVRGFDSNRDIRVDARPAT